jgi:hypothetical protein
MAIETITIDTDKWAVVPKVPQGLQLEITAFNLCSQFGLEFVQAQEKFVRAAYDQMVRNAVPPQQAVSGPENEYSPHEQALRDIRRHARCHMSYYNDPADEVVRTIFEIADNGIEGIKPVALSEDRV